MGMILADAWGPIGAVLAALAIVVGGVLAWWFARGPRLVMQVSGSTLVSRPSDHRISVLYRDKPVQRVTQSLVWIWREGRGTIRAEDIVAADPIKLSVPDGEHVLDADVLAQSKDTNGASVEVETDDVGTNVGVSFEYLDPRQGVLIEVLHTAESPTEISVSGTIMGIPKGIVRVTTDTQVKMPVGVFGSSIEVTIPIHAIPHSLRQASGANTTRNVDLSPLELLKMALRVLLP
jgi:hypothetical protein